MSDAIDLSAVPANDLAERLMVAFDQGHDMPLDVVWELAARAISAEAAARQ